MNVDIHPTTMMLLHRIYDDEELLGVVFGILADLADMKRYEVKDGSNEGHPFIILKFGNENPIMENSTDPPIKFGLN